MIYFVLSMYIQKKAIAIILGKINQNFALVTPNRFNA